MKNIHVPAIDRRYWILISIASVLGANVGDFLSKVLGFGNITGLPLLVILLAVLLTTEYFDQKKLHDAYYWIAVVLVRAAATNIGDFFQRDLKLSKPMTILCLTLALPVALLVGRSVKEFLGFYRKQDDGKVYPTADARYWIAMLIAGTLGTVIGDFVSYGGSHMGNTASSAILSIVLAAVFLVGRRGLLTYIPYYWVCVVAVRSAGTAVGDMLADPQKCGMGLTMSTALFALLYLLLLAIWKMQPRLEPRTI